MRMHPFSKAYLKVIVAGVVMAVVLVASEVFGEGLYGGRSVLLIGCMGALAAYFCALVLMGLEEDEVEILRRIRARGMVRNSVSGRSAV